MPRRKAAKTRPLSSSPVSVPRSPCCHGSRLSAVNPRLARRSSVGAIASFEPVKYGSQTARRCRSAAGSGRVRSTGTESTTSCITRRSLCLRADRVRAGGPCPLPAADALPVI
jgi:hypothetical protein